MYFGALRSGARYTAFVRGQTGGKRRALMIGGQSIDASFLRLAKAPAASSNPTPTDASEVLLALGLPLPIATHPHLDGHCPQPDKAVVQFKSAARAKQVWSARTQLQKHGFFFTQIRQRRTLHAGVGRWPSAQAIEGDIAVAAQHQHLLLGECLYDKAEKLVLLPNSKAVYGLKSVQMTWEEQQAMVSPHKLYITFNDECRNSWLV